MSFENIIKDGNFYQASTGDYGFKLISAGETVTGSFRSIQVLNSNAELTAVCAVGDSITTNLTIPKGAVILGKFTSITLSASSGKVIAYLAS